MTRVIIYVLSLILSVGLFARESLDSSSKREFIDVLKINEDLHLAFYSYNPAKIEIIAKKMDKAIGKIKNKQILKLLTYSRTKLVKITASGERKRNNQNYNQVSMALIHILNTYDLGSRYNSYFCPMVKMKWIQNSTVIAKVHNPYAPYMQHCGAQESHF